MTAAREVEPTHCDSCKTPLTEGRHPDASDYAIEAAAKRLRVDIKELERRFWFGGHQPLAQKAKTKGMKLELADGLVVMTWTMCGRAMITIEDSDASVTAICSEDGRESTMGLQGIDATEEQARSLIERACVAWESGHRLKEDRKVGMGL